MSLGIVFGIIAMLAWGLTDFTSVYIVGKLGDYRTVFWTQFAGFLLLLVAYFFLGHPVTIDKFIWLLMVVGLFDILGYLYFYRGVEKGLISIVSPISSMWAAVTVIMGVVFLSERLDWLQTVAIVLVIVSCMLVSTNLKDFFQAGSKKFAEGIKEGLIAMLAWGSMVVFIASAVHALGWFMPILIMRFFVVLPLYAYMKSRKIEVKFGATKILVLTIVLAAALDIVGFIALNMGLTNYSAALITPVAAAYPLITVVLAYIFYKERLAFNQYLGVVGIIAGIVLLSV